MAKLLFRLNNVPDDEADEVRQLLEDHQFDTYETSAGRFHISVPAIWLKDNSQLPAAREVLAEYQARRAADAQARHAEALARGEQETFAQRFRTAPMRMLVYMLAGIVVLGLSTIPFLHFIQ